MGNVTLDIADRITHTPVVHFPQNVIEIEEGAFSECTSLDSITVDASNRFYSSVAGVLFDKSTNTLIQYPGVKAGTYTIPDHVTSIGDAAFYFCANLTGVTLPDTVTNIGSYAFCFCISLASVTIPGSVASIGEQAFRNCVNLTSVTIRGSATDIGDFAFLYCSSLTAVFFQGNAPIPYLSVFYGATNATVYYLPGATGWGSTFGDRPTVLWNPRVQTNDASFGVQTNQFGFIIIGSSNLVVVVEACTNLASPTWIPVGTNRLNTFIGTNGTAHFSDSEWTNYPGRFYRFRWP